MDKVKKNYYALVEHLTNILENIQDFVSGSKVQIKAFEEKVELLIAFLLDKNAISLLHFNYDIIDLFSIESVYTQKKGASLIGYGSRRNQLIRNVEEIKQLKGREFKKFLSNCNCYETREEADSFLANGQAPSPCTDLDHYENSPFVTFNKNVLEDSELTDQNGTLKFPGISGMVSTYADALVKEIKTRLPSDEVEHFNALDQTKYSLACTRWKIPNIKPLAKIFKMDENVIQKQFKDVLQLLSHNQNWFKENRKSESHYFWGNVLNFFKPPQEFRTLVRKILSVPLG